jgi:hypothetical protein
MSVSWLGFIEQILWRGIVAGPLIRDTAANEWGTETSA